jgi:hypothetical protein
MKFAPPKRPPRHRPVALLVPGWRSLTVHTAEGPPTTLRGEGSCRGALERLSGHVCYTPDSVTHMRHVTDARAWTAEAWRDRIHTISLAGTGLKVLGLRGTLTGSDDMFGDLTRGLEWLHDRGVPAKSLSGMSTYLWRSTLRGEISIGGYTPAGIGRAACYGGRQQVRDRGPRTYTNMACADLVAAYPHSMGAAGYATDLRRISTSTVLDPDTPGIIFGTIEVPQGALPFGPVPQRIAKNMIHFPTGGPVNGAWTWAEARMAENFGCKVLIDQCWAPSGVADLFGAWWPEIAEGRQLGGATARMIKAIANCLWGQFAMTGDDVGVIRWSDPYGAERINIKAAPRRLPYARTAHIAAETTSRVRVRMYQKMDELAPLGSPPHIDTDGFIFRRSALAGMPTEAPPGEFRRKADMRRLELRGPQIYRYLCPSGCGTRHPLYHYCVSGVPPEHAERIFDKVGRRGLSVSIGYGSDDMVLSAHNTLDTGAARAGVLEARSAVGM